MFKFSTEKKSKPGFYIVLFVLLSIVLSTGALMMTGKQKQVPEQQQEISYVPKVQNGTPVPVPTPKNMSLNVAEATPQPTVSAAPTPSGEPTPVPTEQPKKFAPGWPVFGEIAVAYSGNDLVYSKTLEEWRTHKGMDIKSPILSQVKAAFDGKVEKVVKDDLMGITVVIDHGNNIKTVYANLSSMDMIKEGTQVKAGDVINGVGDTALIETGEEAHLHFEIWENGAPVDPAKYLN